MAEVSGNLYLLQQATTYNGSTYVTVACLKANSLQINKAQVDITTKDNAGWLQLLAGGGQKSVALDASGIWDSGNTSHARLVNATLGAQPAHGSIVFGVKPSNNDNVVINGTTWTFKSSGATGNQSNIGATLSDTTQNLVDALNNSTDANISQAHYYVVTGTNTNDTLWIEAKTGGTSGNTFTLADGTQGQSNSTPSGSTLTGGTGTNSNWNFKVTDGTVSFIGSYHIDDYKEDGEVNGVKTFSIKLTSSNTITVSGIS